VYRESMAPRIAHFEDTNNTVRWLLIVP
jgi:hypothetical protein